MLTRAYSCKTTLKFEIVTTSVTPQSPLCPFLILPFLLLRQPLICLLSLETSVFPRFLYKWHHTVCTLVSLGAVILRSVPVVGFISSSLLSSAGQCCVFCFSIHLLMGIWVLSSVGLLPIGPTTNTPMAFAVCPARS